MKSDENLKQIKKGIVEMCVLKVLSKNKRLYTLDIIAEIRASGIDTSEGTIYPLLTRLKNKKILTYEWLESNSGPPRKYYFLTAQGEDYLKQLEKSWISLQQSVNKILK